MRFLGLVPVYVAGGVALFKSLPAPAAKTLYVFGETTTEMYGDTDAWFIAGNPPATDFKWHEVGWSDKRGFYEDTIV